MAAGAALILLTDLVFVNFGDHSFSSIVWASAAMALILILTNGRMAGWSRHGGRTRSSCYWSVRWWVLAAIRDRLYDDLFIRGRSLSVTYYSSGVADPSSFGSLGQGGQSVHA